MKSKIMNGVLKGAARPKFIQGTEASVAGSHWAIQDRTPRHCDRVNQTHGARADGTGEARDGPGVIA